MNIGDLVTCRPKGDTYYLRDPKDNTCSGKLRLSRGETAIVMQIKPYISGYAWDGTHNVLVITTNLLQGWIEEKYIEVV
jgi:hypothetical protein